jgi:hypothetical protein
LVEVGDEATAPQMNPKAAKPQINPKAAKPQINPKAAKPQMNPKATAPQMNPKAAKPQMNPKAAKPQMNPKATTPQNNPKARMPPVIHASCHQGHAGDLVEVGNGVTSRHPHLLPHFHSWQWCDNSRHYQCLQSPMCPSPGACW